MFIPNIFAGLSQEERHQLRMALDDSVSDIRLETQDGSLAALLGEMLQVAPQPAGESWSIPLGQSEEDQPLAWVPRGRLLQGVLVSEAISVQDYTAEEIRAGEAARSKAEEALDARYRQRIQQTQQALFAKGWALDEADELLTHPRLLGILGASTVPVFSHAHMVGVQYEIVDIPRQGKRLDVLRDSLDKPVAEVADALHTLAMDTLTDEAERAAAANVGDPYPEDDAAPVSRKEKANQDRVTEGDSSLPAALDAGLLSFLKTRNQIRQGERSQELASDGWPGGLPTGLGGDRIKNAEAFVRSHAMRNPEQAEKWAEQLRADPHGYAEAVGLEADNLRGIATQMENAVQRIRNPEIGDLVRFEPGEPDDLRAMPFSGRVIAKLDTSTGDYRYHLRAETGPDQGIEATVYGRNGSFRSIGLEDAVGFDRAREQARVREPNPSTTAETPPSASLIATARELASKEFALFENVPMNARSLKPAEIRRNGEFLPSETVTGYLKSIEQGGHVLQFTLRDRTQKTVVSELVMDTDGLAEIGNSKLKSRLDALLNREVTVGALPNGELLADTSFDRLQENLRTLVEGKELPELDAGLKPSAVTRLRMYARVLDSSTLNYVDYSGPDTSQLIQEWAKEDPDGLARDAVELRDRSSEYAKATGLGGYQVRNISHDIQLVLHNRGVSLPPPLAEVDPKEQAIAGYNRFYQELPGNVDKLVKEIRERFATIDPTSKQEYANLLREIQGRADDVLGIIREGSDRGSFRPQLELFHAGVDSETQSSLYATWQEVASREGTRYKNAIDVAREQVKERLEERGKEILRKPEELSDRGIVIACYWKHGVLVEDDSPMIDRMLRAVEGKDIKDLLPWIGENSQNPASIEAFSRLTGVPLGKAQKERVAQLEAWAGPEIVAALRKEEEERAQAEAKEAPRKALRVAFDELSTLQVDMGTKSADGQEFIEAKAQEGFTKVINRKKGAATQRRIQNPELGQSILLKDSRFQAFCKAVQDLEPSGDLVKAMETARIPLSVKQDFVASDGDVARETVANTEEKAAAMNQHIQSVCKRLPGCTLGELTGELRLQDIDCRMGIKEISDLFYLPIHQDSVFVKETDSELEAKGYVSVMQIPGLGKFLVPESAIAEYDGTMAEIEFLENGDTESQTTAETVENNRIA